MSHFEVPKSYLCDILLNVKNEVRNANTLLTYIDQDYDINSVDKEIMKKQSKTTFIPTFKTKLSKACNNVTKFRVSNEKWLNDIFTIECTGKRGRKIHFWIKHRSAIFDPPSWIRKFCFSNSRFVISNPKNP